MGWRRLQASRIMSGNALGVVSIYNMHVRQKSFEISKMGTTTGTRHVVKIHCEWTKTGGLPIPDIITNIRASALASSNICSDGLAPCFVPAFNFVTEIKTKLSWCCVVANLLTFSLIRAYAFLKSAI